MRPTKEASTKRDIRRGSAEHKEMDSKALSKAKAYHTSPSKRRPSLLGERLFASDTSTSSTGDLSVHSLGALHEVSKCYSTDAFYGYENTEIDYYDGSKSDSMIDFRRGTEETPRTKRRRLMQRRNSQTPAMLVASSATVFVASGGFGDTVERGVDVDEALNMSLMSLASTDVSETTRLNGSSSTTDSTYNSQCWPEGVEIATELVKHFQRGEN